MSIGDSCFSRCRLTVFENLPCLREIGLGSGVFEGADGAKNTLIMKSSSTVHPPSIDLSKLQSLLAGKKVLRCITNATLMSCTHSIPSHADIPSIESLRLPRAFESISTLTISSTHEAKVSHADASELEGLQNLQPCVTRRFTIKSLAEFNSLPNDTMEITVNNNCCNESRVGAVDFSRFTQLKLLRIGDHCFWHGTALRLVGLNALKTLEVGVNCFNGNAKDSAFVLQDCAALRTVDLGYCSFCHFVSCEMRGGCGEKG